MLIIVGLGGRVFGSEQGSSLPGTVVDDAGKPIPGASVSAWSSAAGMLRDQVKGAGQTDARGRFELSVAFGDIWYTVWARKPGYESKSVDALAGGEPASVSLKRLPRHSLGGSVRKSGGGEPAAGAAVVLIPGSGERREVRADASGRFEIDDLSDDVGQAVIYARADGSVSPYLLAKARDRQVALVLGKPARLEGQVIDRYSDKGASGCQVVLSPDFISGFMIETQSSKDGQYAFADVPPGRYKVGAMRDDLYERGAQRAELGLQAGQTEEQDIGMHRRAKVTGRVWGYDDRPVEGAMVGMDSHFGVHHGYLWVTARTDAHGAFTLLTGKVNEKERIHAFSARHGEGWMEAFIDEEQPDPVTIRLSGAMRLRGTITSTDGRPVAGAEVECGGKPGGVVSDAKGRFDAGWIPLAVKPQERQPFNVHCARPVTTAMFSSPRARSVETGERFYLHTASEFTARPGHEIDVSVKVRPAELLTFTGRVLDTQGKTVPRSKVILFAGNAQEKTWIDDLHPMRRMASSRIIPASEYNATLGTTEADEQGRWTIHAVRETAESLKVAFPLIPFEAGVFSLGAEGEGGAKVLKRDVRPKPGRTSVKVDLSLGAVSTTKAR